MSDTETSSRRAEANRRNAQKSTGPRTAEGKERSRFNALKHGMRAATPVLPGEDKAAFDDRLDRWAKDLAPRDDVEQFLVKRAVELSWQLERADRAIALSRQPAEERIAAVADEVIALGAGCSGTRADRSASIPRSPSRMGCSARARGTARSTTPTTRPGW